MTHFARDTPCQTDPSLFDGEDYDCIKLAINWCKTGCHALAECHAWAKGRKDLTGVVAGIPRGESIDKWRRGRVTLGRPRRET